MKNLKKVLFVIHIFLFSVYPSTTVGMEGSSTGQQAVTQAPLQVEVEGETFTLSPEIVKLSKTLQNLIIPRESVTLFLEEEAEPFVIQLGEQEDIQQELSLPEIPLKPFKQFLALAEEIIKQPQQSPSNIMNFVYNSLNNASIEKLSQLAHVADYLNVEKIVFPCLTQLTSRLLTTAQNQPHQLLTLMEQIKFKGYPLYRRLVDIINPCVMAQALWSIRQQPIILPSQGGSNLTSFVWSPDGTKVTSVNYDGLIYTWNVLTRDLLSNVLITIDEDTPVPIHFYFSPDKTKIAGEDIDNNIIIIWDAATGHQVQKLKKRHEGPINSINWNPDSTKIASSSKDNIIIWDASTGQISQEIKAPADYIFSLVWSPDGTKIASGGDKIYIWDASTGQPLHKIDLSKRVSSLVWNPNSTKIISGNENGTLQIWDASTGQQLFEFQGHTGLIKSIAWSPDDTKFASSDSNTIKIWNARTGFQSNYFTLNNLIKQISFSPDSTKIAILRNATTNLIIRVLKDSSLERDCKNLIFEHLAPLLIYYYQSNNKNIPFTWHQHPDLLEIAYTLPKSIKDLLNLPPQTSAD